jgi:hypothetical protein
MDETACRAIDQIIDETVAEPIGPEFMAPPLESR